MVALTLCGVQLCIAQGGTRGSDADSQRAALPRKAARCNCRAAVSQAAPLQTSSQHVMQGLWGRQNETQLVGLAAATELAQQ